MFLNKGGIAEGKWFRWPVFLFLLTAGCLQMAGDLLAIPALKGFGLATQVSPAPKVFTAHEGFETYSSEFFISWQDAENRRHKMQVTPALYYKGVLGPYNRRNAYGAALSYAPVLNDNPRTRPMFESVAYYAVCKPAPMLSELGIDAASVRGPVTITLAPRQKLPETHKWKLEYEISCVQ